MNAWGYVDTVEDSFYFDKNVKANRNKDQMHISAEAYLAASNNLDIIEIEKKKTSWGHDRTPTFFQWNCVSILWQTQPETQCFDP